ncbi:hypothetical protein Tco_0727368 [Tanacetum coccineum]|uniref:Reverse transcriptase domain-containing protein n=1 Tax=Tanacetum coccineum TaxID=301880 RepID=A0ABQ4YKQ2_9ASTR
MSNHEQPTPSHPKSDVRNTVGNDKQTPQGSARTTSVVNLEDFCEKHYEKLLPIMADKYEYERRKKEKLEEVKVRLDFGEARRKSTQAHESAYSEFRTMSPRRQRRSRSPRHSPSVFTRLRRESRQESSRYTENHSESEDSEGGDWKSKSRRQKSSVEDDDLSQPWEGGHRQNFKKGGGFRSQHKQEKRPDRFTLLTKTPREILALEKGKFKTPPPMTTPVEKRNANKFCEFHGEIGHNTDECNHLRRQIEDMLKAGKLSHIIKELKQNSAKDQQKKKGETSRKEKPQAILMIQSWQKIVRQKISQSFSPNLEISFPSLGDDEGAKGPLIIEAEIGGHQVHRMCVDGGSSFEILYEHCFNRLRPEIRNQMIPATTSLVGFSGEIKWPLGQITLLVKIGDDEHSTSTWMDFHIYINNSIYTESLKD